MARPLEQLGQEFTAAEVPWSETGDFPDASVGQGRRGERRGTGLCVERTSAPHREAIVASEGDTV